MKKKLALQVIIKLIAVAVGILTSRWLNDYLTNEQRSLFTTVSAISILVVGILEFGLPRLIQKYFTNWHDKEEIGHYWSTMWLIRVGSLVLALPVLGLCNYFFKINDFWLLFSLYLTQFILISDQSFRGLLDAKGKGFLFSATDLVGKLILITGLYFIVGKILGQTGIWTFVWSAGIGYGLSFAIDWFLTRKMVNFKSPSWTIWQDNYKQIGLLTLSSLVATTYIRTDVLYLNYFGATAQAINSYDNAFKLYEVATVAPGVLIPTISSHLKKLIDKGQNQLEKRKIIQKYLALSLCFGFGCTLSVLVFGNLGLWLTGAITKYLLAAVYLPILALALLFFPTVILISNLFIFFGEEKRETQSVIVVAIYSFFAYTILVSQFGAIGASWANVSLLFFDFVVKLFLFWKYIWCKV
jgi:O-antigen/teichoic acid export membrane protein